MKAEARSGLLGNVFSLAVVQGAEYLVPLLAIPYLMRVLGAEGYGQIAFAQAIGVYLVMVTEYGFNMVGTREAAVLRDDRLALSRLFWSVQLVKLLLAVLVGCVLSLLVLTVGKLRHQSGVMLLSLLPVLGTVLYPLWLLQGLEMMKQIAAVMMGVRLLMLAGLFLTVTRPDQIGLAAFFLFAAAPVAGVWACFLIVRRRCVVWVAPSWSGVKAQFKLGWAAFYVTVSASVYRSGNAVVLGFLATPSMVAYYAIAEKVVKAAQEVARPISQASFPRVSALVAESSEAAQELLRKLLLSIGGLGVLTSTAVLALAPYIVSALSGSRAEEAVQVMRLMALIPLLGSVNQVLGVQTMLPFGWERPFSRYVGWAGASDLVMVAPLIWLWGVSGAAFAYVASEVVLLVCLLWYLRRQGMTYFLLRQSPSA